MYSKADKACKCCDDAHLTDSGVRNEKGETWNIYWADLERHNPTEDSDHDDHDKYLELKGI